MAGGTKLASERNEQQHVTTDSRAPQRACEWRLTQLRERVRDARDARAEDARDGGLLGRQ